MPRLYRFKDRRRIKRQYILESARGPQQFIMFGTYEEDGNDIFHTVQKYGKTHVILKKETHEYTPQQKSFEDFIL